MKRRIVKKRSVIKPKPRVRQVSKKPRKVKVLFVCGLGERASVNRKLSFGNILHKRKLSGLFELKTAGVDVLKPMQLRKLLLSQDYIVTCDHLIDFRVKKALGQTEKPLLHLEPNTPDEPLRGLLSRIVKEQGIKRSKGKKK